MNITKIIVGELETNCYLIEKDNNCLLIDPGAEYYKIKKIDMIESLKSVE